MTIDPVDTLKTAAEMMNVTRSAWHLGRRSDRHRLPGEHDAFAWPVGEAAQANSLGDKVEQFLRSQE